jgi:hopene-associated glycosyltransferase HpnB
MILQIAAAAALAIWLYLVFARGRFWLEFIHHSPAPGPLIRPPSIVAVIPARNEAPVVAQAIRSLCAQKYPGDFHIVLVDDGSDDGTADAARAAAPEDLLAVISAQPTPAGWTGKMWAVAEGVRRSASFAPDLILLTDADIVHGPGTLEQLAARVESGYGLASYMATLECHTVAEQLLIPAFVYFFFMLYPPAWVANPSRRTAGAAGGCMLIRRALLEKIGGIAAIRGELIDDCALAREAKRHGARIWLSLSRETRSIRPYQSFGEIGSMISRTAFTQLHHSALLLIATLLGMVLTYFVPVAASLSSNVQTAGLGSLASLLMAASYFPALRFYRRSILWSVVWAPFLPLVAMFYLGATVRSALSYWRGSGGLWKGRIQDAAPRP